MIGAAKCDYFKFFDFMRRNDSIRIHPTAKLSRLMKIKFTPMKFLCLLLLLVPLDSPASAAQEFAAEVRIEILSATPARVGVEGKLLKGMSVWSFPNTYASAKRLAERITKFTLADESGANVSVHKISPGEYTSESAATRFRYEVNLEPSFNSASEANVSWLVSKRALLMLGDLLPRGFTNVKINLSLPARWSASSVEEKSGRNEFAVSEPDLAIFFVGEDLRESHERIGEMNFTFVIGGDWAFGEKEATAAGVDILQQYTETMGGTPQRRATVMLSPFPQPVSASRWSAETRGATVVFVSGQASSTAAGLSQLSIRLAHELFHLWTPNGLALDGEYDWFYEGFTLYYALQTCRRLQLLTFREYLDAIGRAYDAYLTAPERKKLSLLDASRRRWSGAASASLVYNKGMLVAFLYDLELRKRTRGKRSLENVYGELFQRYKKGGSRADGNAAVLAALNSEQEMKKITERFIEKADAIELNAAIKPFGLRIDKAGFTSVISADESLSERQRELLKELGYNE